MDCANGAAYRVAPTVLAELGADVIRIGDSPDGFNINKDCGSTQPASLCRAVRPAARTARAASSASPRVNCGVRPVIWNWQQPVERVQLRSTGRRTRSS